PAAPRVRATRAVGTARRFAQPLPVTGGWTDRRSPERNPPWVPFRTIDGADAPTGRAFRQLEALLDRTARPADLENATCARDHRYFTCLQRAGQSAGAARPSGAKPEVLAEQAAHRTWACPAAACAIGAGGSTDPSAGP